MFIHEYGNSNNPTIILLHPMEVTGVDLYNIIAPHLKGEYHIISPDQGGHGYSAPYVSSLEEAAELEDYLIKNNCINIALIFAASMGVGTAFELVKRGKLNIKKMWLDGGCMVAKSSLLTKMITAMFIKRHRYLENNPDDPCTKLVKQYGKVFAAIMKSNFIALSEEDINNIWNSFTHCNFDPIATEVQKTIHFDYGIKDMNLKGAKKILKKNFSNSSLTVRKGYGHCGYFAYKPEEYVSEMESFI